MKRALLAVVMVAQSAQAAAVAQSDARRGRELVRAGRYSDGCPLLERARVADPSLPALLQVADCWERAGRPVKAYALYDEAAVWAESRHDVVRGELVRARLAALETKLSFLVVSSVAYEPGLSVRAGEIELPLAAELLLPVDGGGVVLTASAPGFVAWSARVEMNGKHRLPLIVPPLLPSVVEVPPPPPLPVVPGSPSAVVIERAAPSRAGPLLLLSGSAMVFIAGLAGLSWSFTSWSALQAQQPGGASAGNPTVTRPQLETMSRVYPASWVATGVGLVGAAVGFLWLGTSRSTTTVRVTPAAGGLAVSGSF
jgi:hypothetical protein